MCTIHMYTCTHTHNTCIDIYTHVYTHMRTHAHTHMRTHAHTHTCTHTMLMYANYMHPPGGLEEPDIVSKVVTDEADFIDFENSKNLSCGV